jgi:hypothetical protein
LRSNRMLQNSWVQYMQPGTNDSGHIQKCDPALCAQGMQKWAITEQWPVTIQEASRCVLFPAISDLWHIQQATDWRQLKLPLHRGLQWGFLCGPMKRLSLPVNTAQFRYKAPRHRAKAVYLVQQLWIPRMGTWASSQAYQEESL